MIRGLCSRGFFKVVGALARIRSDPAVWLATAAAFGWLPSATLAAGEFEERRDAVIRELASRYEPREDYGPDRYGRFGFDAIYLIAKLEERRRGLGEGTTVAREREVIRQLAAGAAEHLGSPGDPGPWSWEKTGSPAVKQAALAFGWLLHQYGKELEEEVREHMRWALEESTWSEGYTQYLFNYRANVMAGRLLAGEFFGHESSLWRKAREEWDTLYRRTMSHGGIEMNAPIYTSYHWAPLTFLQKLRDDETRAKARILLDYNLIVHGHLYIPGGGIGVPQSRNRAGALNPRGSLTRMFAQFFPALPLEGEPSDWSWHQVLALGDYRPPAVIESFFTDKGNGYSFWCYTDAPVVDPKPHTVYRLGPDGATVSPWEVVFAPAGDVMMGTAYGFRYQGIQVNMGVWARDPQGDFHVLYHAQPLVVGDTADNPRRRIPTTTSRDPYDWIGEGYDYERMMYGRTLLSLWNPTLEGKAPGVIRTHQDTRVHLPNYAKFGGEVLEAEGWFVGRMGSTYIAYRPLGEVVHREWREEGNALYMTLDGESGCIVELATLDQFPSVESYAADLADRHLRFDREELWLEFDALDPVAEAEVRLRLEYRPERRFVAGQELTMEELDRGFIDSPWVDWEPKTRRMIVEREGYSRLIYDIPSAQVLD